MAKTIVMKDIAQELGISIVSVSKALRGMDGVSDQVRANILETAKKMGYRYETNKKTETTASGNIGIISADRFFSEMSFYTEMYKKVSVCCTRMHYTGILEIISAEEEKDLALPHLLADGKVDGLILMGEFAPRYVKMIANQNIPYMLLDFYDELFDSDCVVSDGTFGTLKLTNYLIEKGHRSIAFLGSRLSTSSIMDRYLGYYKALLKNGLPLNESLVIDDRDEQGVFVDFELPSPLPDAFVCNCDETALLLVKKLKHCGYRVPQDVSVVGFDDYRCATQCDPPLTTYKVNMQMMSHSAVGQLVRKINHKLFTSGRTMVSGECVFRHSVAQR